MVPDRLVDVKRFYEILEILEEKLGGKRILANSDGRTGWPQRGVYFFFETGEFRTTSGTGMRVVRVGTHALKTKGKSTLWGRLSQHQGTINSGGGNHRGSIFRMHVRAAMINRDNWTNDGARTWGQGSSAKSEVRVKEHFLEQAVSQYIRSMPFLWVSIGDEPGPNSLRGYIERNSIALLSNYNNIQPIDPPCNNWLGNWSPNQHVKNSGLWNVNHINDEYSVDFLNVFAHLV